MARRQISELINSSLESISSLIDANKVIGKPIYIDENKIIIPITKVTMGFGVGGSEFNVQKKEKKIKNNLSFETIEEPYPYGGGEVGGVSLMPEAFIIVNENKSEIIYFDKNPTLFEKTLDIVRDILRNRTKKEKR